MENHIEKIRNMMEEDTYFQSMAIFIVGITICFSMIMFPIEKEKLSSFYSILYLSAPFIIQGITWYLLITLKDRKKIKIKNKIKNEIDCIESLNNGFLKLYKDTENKKMLNEITPDSEFIKKVYLKISGDKLFENKDYNLLKKYLILLENINHVNKINKIHEENEQRVLLEERQKELENQKKDYSRTLNREKKIFDKINIFTQKIKKYI